MGLCALADRPLTTRHGGAGSAPHQGVDMSVRRVPTTLTNDRTGEVIIHRPQVRT